MYRIRLPTPLRARVRSISTKSVDLAGTQLASYGPKEIERSQFMNGISVAAAKGLGHKMAAITIMFQAGSRFEVDDQLGATHFLRVVSDCTGKGYSGFTKSRALQQLGGSITCTSDRQTIAYTLRCPPVIFSEVRGYFLDTACRLPTPLRARVRSISTKSVDLAGTQLASYGPKEIERSQFMNGISVAAAKGLGHKMAAITIMFQAGSRFEVDDQLGATHFLRVVSDCTGKGYSGFTKSRALQQLGGSITCTSDRQTIAYTLRCPPVIFSEVRGYFLDTACRPDFRQWEIDDRKYLVREELQRMTPEQRVLDLVQKACWGGSVSNSIFCEEERIDTMSADALDCYVTTHFRTKQCTVASVGLPFEETIRFAECIEFCKDVPLPRYTSPYPRGGFELYDLGPSSDTWIALAIPSCGTLDIRGLVIHAIIAAACGVDNIAMGHSLDRTPQSPLCSLAGSDVHTEYRAFNISNRDSGVFGILAKSKADTACNAALTAANFLPYVSYLTNDKVLIGKNRLKLDLAIHDSDCVRLSEGLALQTMNRVVLDGVKDFMALIDDIRFGEVFSAAQALSCSCGKMAYAVVGDITRVPLDRELVCTSPAMI